MAKPHGSRRRPSNRTNLASCAVATIFLLFLLAVLLIVYFTVFKPKDPKISVNAVQLPSFAVSNNTANFTFSQYVAVRNPNRAVFSHYDSSIQLLYSGNQVGFMFIPAGKIDSGRTQYMAATFTVQSFPISPPSSSAIATVSAAVVPDSPVLPGPPDFTVTPDSPKIPDSPDLPGDPATPDFPGNPGPPSFPRTPGSPDFPGNPGSPTLPRNPGSPEFQGNPPRNPGSPVNPGNPGSGYPRNMGPPGFPGMGAPPGFPGTGAPPGFPGIGAPPGFPGIGAPPGFPGTPVGIGGGTGPTLGDGYANPGFGYGNRGGPTIEIESKMELAGRVKVLHVFTHHVVAKSDCRVTVSIADGSVLGFHC
uniref:Accumulation-associated protein n=1 Tax=Noccaea caerulescens TaxID=107243 RepID=A0A1J3F483_NOCCA